MIKQIRALQREEKKEKSGEKRGASGGQGGTRIREENQGLRAIEATQQTTRAIRRRKGNRSLAYRQLQVALQLRLQAIAASNVTQSDK